MDLFIYFLIFFWLYFRKLCIMSNSVFKLSFLWRGWGGFLLSVVCLSINKPHCPPVLSAVSVLQGAVARGGRERHGVEGASLVADPGGEVVERFA